MRTITCYKFSELPSKLQDEKREEILKSLSEIADLEPTAEELKEGLEEVGFYEVEINYSVYGGQGDGASFTAKISEADACKLLNQEPGMDAEQNVIVFNRICHHYTPRENRYC